MFFEAKMNLGTADVSPCLSPSFSRPSQYNIKYKFKPKCTSTEQLSTGMDGMHRWGLVSSAQGPHKTCLEGPTVSVGQCREEDPGNLVGVGCTEQHSRVSCTKGAINSG